MNDPLTLTPAALVDLVAADYELGQFGPLEVLMRLMLADAIARAEARELYIVQAENGDVVDVTWSRAYADRLVDPDDPDVPTRSLVVERAWYGEDDE